MISQCNRLFIIYLVIFFTLLPTRIGIAFTVGEEKELGEKLLYTIRSNFQVLDDPDLKQYVTKLGEEVLVTAGVQFFNYHFFIIKNKEFNAFAAPSGLIFFHSGLIEKVESENEFVSVLAHEIGHIVKRHLASRIDKDKKISIATMGLALASLALGGGAITEALLTGSMAAGQSARLHFSRLDEEEADLLAYDWMKELNRSPEGQVGMLQTMRQIARYRSGMIPQYLLTHPNPESRLDYVQSLVEYEKKEIAEMDRGDDVAFLRFKFRILTQVKESIFLRGYYSSILSSDKVSQDTRMMAKYGLAQLDSAENNYSSSLELMNEVIEYFNDKNIFLIDLGIIEFESGNAEKAYEILNKAFDKNRANMYAAFALAKVCFNIGKFDKAENLFKSVMYEIPEFAKVYYELGRLSAAKGLPAETNFYLGKFYLYEGKLKLSRNKLDTALKSKSLPSEIELDAKRSLELIDRLEK